MFESFDRLQIASRALFYINCIDLVNVFFNCINHVILILVSKPIDQIWLVEQTNRPDLASGEIQPDLASGEIDQIWLVEKWTTFGIEK